MTLSKRQPAVIYCRVSDKGQTGLGSQEHRCRQHAEAKNYEVVKVFHDKKTGGGDFMKREGMVNLLRFLDTYPHLNFVVIFDDLRRYARDAEFHLTLRRIMKERGAVRECLNYRFEDSPEGKFNETINAAVSELEREANARQNRQKKIARLEAGYSIINHAPIGYKYVKASRGNNKVMVRDEPYASIIQSALEGYAAGRFASLTEVSRYLEAHPVILKRTSNGRVRVHRVTQILKQPMYAGYVCSKELGVPLTPAKHEALISKATYEKILHNMTEKANAPARKDLGQDFMLRGAVACSECHTPLRSCWSKGQNKHYAYYLCHTKGCSLYGKSIPRAEIETAFDAVLKRIQPSQNLLTVATAMFRLYWDRKAHDVKDTAKAIQTEIEEAENQVQKLIDRIVQTTNSRVIKALENGIDELEKKKILLAEKLEKSAKPRPDFQVNLEHALKFLSNPYGIWRSGTFEMKRLVLRLVFSGHLLYDRENGYRTPQTSLPFNMLGEKMSDFLPEMFDGAAAET